ncbi:hypothetical protein [Nocardia brasiliensis]
MQLSGTRPRWSFDAKSTASQCNQLRLRIGRHCSPGVPLQLMHGNGNVIAVLAGFRGSATLRERATLARYVCAQFTTVRVDGVAFLRWTESMVRFWFHDRDGTYEPTCGNGLRCATRLLSDLGQLTGRTEIVTDIGPRRVRMAHGEPVVSVGSPREGRRLGPNCFFVVTDIPHLVLLYGPVDDVDVAMHGSRMAHDRRLCRAVGHPEGLHVDFVALTAAGIDLRTYEIGVEDETAACGTGAAAAACIATWLGFHRMPVEVCTRGGTLVVSSERGELFITGQVDYLVRPHH